MSKAVKKIVSGTKSLSLRLAITTFVAVLLLLLASAISSRWKDRLEPWHLNVPRNEFDDNQYHADYSLANYLKQEEKLFSELDSYLISTDRRGKHSEIVRYLKGSPSDSTSFEKNWNRTFEFVPEEIKGGVLLLHGLSDSPYSMRSVGEELFKKGYYVLGLRLPGHGTVPSALLNVSFFDWLAAVKLGASHVARMANKGPFYIAGYSNGGALALKYTSDVLIKKENEKPDGIILFSPAIGISKLARASNWHKIFTWIPYFKKDEWLSLQPEYDPYKYNSFAKNAGAQAYYLSLAVQTNLALLEKLGRADELPAILTFQSAVDSTVVTEALFSKLYARLPQNGSKLVVFDVNHASYFDGFIANNPRQALARLEQSAELPFEMIVVTNAAGGSREVIARKKKSKTRSFEDYSLNVVWPKQVFSLSHLGIPFPPEDSIYGRGEGDKDVILGNLAVRGERGVLSIPSDQLMRLRYNPFHAFMIDVLSDWVQ